MLKLLKSGKNCMVAEKSQNCAPQDSSSLGGDCLLGVEFDLNFIHTYPPAFTVLRDISFCVKLVYAYNDVSFVQEHSVRCYVSLSLSLH